MHHFKWDHNGRYCFHDFATQLIRAFNGNILTFLHWQSTTWIQKVSKSSSLSNHSFIIQSVNHQESKFCGVTAKLVAVSDYIMNKNSDSTASSSVGLYFTLLSFELHSRGVCDVTILDREQLECVHNPLLHRDCLHCVSVCIQSVAVLGSDTQPMFFVNQITIFATPFCSSLP